MTIRAIILFSLASLLSYTDAASDELDALIKLDHLKLLARSGDPEAQYTLGDQLLNKWETQEEGLKWMRTAVEQGYPKAADVFMQAYAALRARDSDYNSTTYFMALYAKKSLDPSIIKRADKIIQSLEKELDPTDRKEIAKKVKEFQPQELIRNSDANYGKAFQIFYDKINNIRKKNKTSKIHIRAASEITFKFRQGNRAAPIEAIMRTRPEYNLISKEGDQYEHRFLYVGGIWYIASHRYRTLNMKGTPISDWTKANRSLGFAVMYGAYSPYPYQ